MITVRLAPNKRSNLTKNSIAYAISRIRKKDNEADMLARVKRINELLDTPHVQAKLFEFVGEILTN